MDCAAPSRVEASAAVAVPFALSRAAMALSQRRYCGSAASAPEVISLDDIEVEAVGWSPDHAEHHDNETQKVVVCERLRRKVMPM